MFIIKRVIMFFMLGAMLVSTIGCPGLEQIFGGGNQGSQENPQQDSQENN